MLLYTKEIHLGVEMNEPNENDINRTFEELVAPVETPTPVPTDAAAALIDFCYRLKNHIPYISYEA